MAKQIKAKARGRAPELLPETATATAMPTTRLMLRGNVYAARIHVPTDLWEKFGRKEIWKSLRTTDRRVATLRLHQFCAEVEAEFTRLRRGPTLQQRFMEILTAPLRDPNLSDDAKVQHIREQAAKFAAHVSPEQMHTHWVAQTRPTDKTAAEGLRAMRLLVGALSCSAITREHVVSTRDRWLQRAAPGTVKKRLGLCGAIFQTAMADGKFGVKVNPVHGVLVRKARVPIKRRGIWSSADIATFTNAHPSGPLRDLLTLLQWTGARLGEITGLRAQDIHLDDPVPHIVIEPHAERRLKSEESTRRVPLANKVVQNAAERVAAGSLAGTTTQASSKQFNRARRALGIPHDAHALRHGFKLAWRACGLPEDQGDAIQGHSNGSVSRTYGSAAGYPLRPLYQSVKRLKFE